MKILVITMHPWRDDNTTGNSYTNIFKGMDSVEFAHIYCQNELPNVNIAARVFQISESRMIKSIIKKDIKTGQEVYFESEARNKAPVFSKSYNIFKSLHWRIFYWGREMIWLLGKWKTKELNDFLDDFKPDLIFVHLANFSYLNRIISYVKDYTGVPLVSYTWDDIYTYKQFSLSPMFWIDRWIQRKGIRKVAKKSEFLYVISEEQKQEYSKIFGKECKLLYKSYDFKKSDFKMKSVNNPLQIIYMGQIGQNRWKTLSRIGRILDKINADGVKVQLKVYTVSSKTEKMIESLSIGKSCQLMDYVPPTLVDTVLNSADILLHVEPMNRADILFYRLSFSTKIVDYFKAARCIMAIGGDETATMKYLKKYDAAIVINDEKQIKRTIEELVSNPKLVEEYMKKAWNCGYERHQNNVIQNKVFEQLSNSVTR